MPGLGSRSSADFRGVRVLIPLCGDTPALKFFAELGCDVTGIELVQTALDLAKTDLFPSLTFTSTVRDGAGRCDTASVPLDDGGHGSITLICGDLFVALQEYVSNPFDIVYDRHSFGAIQPDMRPLYARTVAAVLRQPSSPTRPSILGPNAGLYFMQVAHRRDANPSAGPPFHVSVELVESHFNGDGACSGVEWSYGSVPVFSEGEQVAHPLLSLMRECNIYGVLRAAP